MLEFFEVIGIELPIFATLFIWLLIHMKKENAKREERLLIALGKAQEIMIGLTESYGRIADDLNAISIIVKSDSSS